MLFIYISLLLNFILIFYFKKLSQIINLFDVPDNKRKFHKKPTAAIGGFVILLNVFAFFTYQSYLYFFQYLDFKYYNYFDFLIFYLFFFLFFIIGYLDDKLSLGPNLKLLLFSIFSVSILLLTNNLALSSIEFSFLEKSIDMGSTSIAFTVLCILLFVNAFNMFDGINLQSSIYSLHIFIIFILQGIFIDISAVMIVSLLFFSYLNFKNKCFLGNNGSLAIAFVIAYLFIKSQSSNHPFFADEIFLAMQIPGIDLIRLAIERTIAKKHPFYPDRNHIHHILMKKYGYQKTLFFLSCLIIVPNFLSTLYGNTIYYIVFSFIVYFFILFKLKKN